MTTKTTRTLYWVFTILLCLLLVADGIGGIMQEPHGQEVLRHLGYPMYLLVISGVAKLLSVVAILQTRWQTIKEWAYAGNAFNFVCAFASRAFVGDGFFDTIFPLLMLGFMFIPYFLWKKTSSKIHPGSLPGIV
jgi:hypothetical protein